MRMRIYLAGNNLTAGLEEKLFTLVSEGGGSGRLYSFWLHGSLKGDGARGRGHKDFLVGLAFNNGKQKNENISSQ